MPAEFFFCEDCGKVFTRQLNLHRHQRSTHESDSFVFVRHVDNASIDETIIYVIREITPNL